MRLLAQMKKKRKVCIILKGFIVVKNIFTKDINNKKNISNISKPNSKNDYNSNISKTKLGNLDKKYTKESLSQNKFKKPVYNKSKDNKVERSIERDKSFEKKIINIQREKVIKTNNNVNKDKTKERVNNIIPVNKSKKMLDSEYKTIDNSNHNNFKDKEKIAYQKEIQKLK